MEFEWQEECKSALERGIKTDVLTRPDMWHIDNLFWDNLSHSWYVRATPIIPEETNGKKYCEFIDFHVTSVYFKKVTKGVKPYTLVD